MVYYIGLGWGAYKVKECPLLQEVQTDLADSRAATALLMIVSIMKVVERSGDVVTGTSLLESSGILEFLFMFKVILESSITCGLTCALASISDGVQKRMADLVVPAGEENFRERIHEPV
eukprot:6303558-Pyramimonas_sp.AAC.1